MDTDISGGVVDVTRTLYALLMDENGRLLVGKTATRDYVTPSNAKQ